MAAPQAFRLYRRNANPVSNRVRRGIREMRSNMKFGVSTLWLLAMPMAWLSVVGCGGGSNHASQPGTYTVGGTITGFTGSGLVLEDNGGSDLAVPANATRFTFATPVTGVYSVTVLTQPAGQTCTVSGGSGTATANVTGVQVTCSPLYTVGGSIAGLTGPGLVLEDNGGDNLAVAAGAGSFTFSTPLAAGSAYSITVAAQPVGQSCAVSGGTGKVTGNVTDAALTCSQVYAVGGTVTGLHSSGLVLQNEGGDNLSLSPEASSFVFATPLAAGSPYRITVLSQPSGENCTVSGSSGTVVSDVVDAGLVCVGEWAWMGGSSTLGLNSALAGVYGSQGTPDPANIPGGRAMAASWTDASGNRWLFGGQGNDANGTGGILNDLWKFDPSLGSAGEWSWVSGSSVAPPPIAYGIPNGMPGIYGTLGVASTSSSPGARTQAARWTDAEGNLWLFGGYGLDAVGAYGYLNDLWKFSPTVGEWTWVAGSSTLSSGKQAGIYGTLGVPASGNLPGARYGAFVWSDAAGDFWLFGGHGLDAQGTTALLNDLWEYRPGTNGAAGTWAWMSGSSTVPPAPSPFVDALLSGVYGTLGSPDPANVPGSRDTGVSWTDASGNLWLFGGYGGDSTGSEGYLNDLWEYTPASGGAPGSWTWMGGGDTVGNNGGQPGVYGVAGLPADTNVPGARFGATGWIDAYGSLWLFGGQGYDWASATPGLLNDLWKYTPGPDGSIGQWTWMAGASLIPASLDPIDGVPGGQPGIYGTLGTPAPANAPGARYGAPSWTDSSGGLWLFGGQGADATGAQGALNDLWRFQP